MLLKTDDIEKLEDRYRTLFINSLSGFKNASIIGTCDRKKHTNLAIFTSVFHVGAHPPLIGIIIRPHSVSRHTLDNILQTEAYTINHVNKSIYKQAHQTSARYSKEISEFKAVALTEEWQPDFSAPFVKESQIQLGMKLKEHQTLEVNKTNLIIGEIVFINIKNDIVDNKGHVDIERAKTIVVSSLDTYHETRKLSRLEYAKPENHLKK